MDIVYKNEAVESKSTPSCSVYSYSIHEKDISGAVAHIRGRYPDTGAMVNSRCKEMVYVISGSGQAIVDGKVTPLLKGAVILILSGEKFVWEGNMEIAIFCTPEWTREQYIHIRNEEGV